MTFVSLMNVHSSLRTVDSTTSLSAEWKRKRNGLLQLLSSLSSVYPGLLYFSIIVDTSADEAERGLLYPSILNDIIQGADHLGVRYMYCIHTHAFM